MGGGSWEDTPPLWPELFSSKGIRVVPFTPSNVGYEVAWKSEFLAEAEGLPLKSVTLTTSRGSKTGELVITKYGVEGTPIYFCGKEGLAHVDLKPDLTLPQLLERLESVKENLSPLRRAKRVLKLSPASEALLFHHAPPSAREDLRGFAQVIKSFPLELLRPRPLEEAISSRGGIALDEITETHELKRYPGLYCGGEMLDWDAPTGGFLIQACVSQGKVIGILSAGPRVKA